MTGVRVTQAGPSTLVQDPGRPGLARLGVGASGAADRAALALANRLVGNPSSAAALEILLGPFAVVPLRDVWVAVTGAWGAGCVDGHALEPHTATLVPAGATLSLGVAAQGLRYVLGVRGGIETDTVLGSRATDTLAGLGPAPVRDGTTLAIGPEPVEPVPVADLVPVDPPSAGDLLVDVLPGPRRDWFDDDAWATLAGTRWTVSARSDRTGIRLEGPPLARSALGARLGELPSEGMVRGGIQVSPDGAPTVLGADHPVTGGYPVIGVVTAASMDRLAQARPGQGVRMRTHGG
ncbi:biotin-dependent carboxyltransferase family protein [Galbitalea sp. SE-J8]|uniref:5-oxoprolinase subunit C family protein n=1 Tax=Galbitalea sp. SE-J8 TaxID=3054952 RepID=UPI00259C899D|nr:biotin-dependent carboxyltransferase family protein [Galbitalea sp. SE-J8]MDM4763796.1 biotin-dependent carboxyltransferase family protein [Galbitalea sp. SE-J8]